ncbi:polysaccharide biosynthesis tyrosine autokinase [Synechococcus sp. CBW1006]|uniref:polysaccharide biosynthesis tyrosine autokinase n=1 Tax=Synechococcus sp. CBW1006 TaxID=1353138 RepID=UPI0018CFCD43|nr:tyrosine-protein kinase domain-containing protein [Synechococcus sp. CBW1006]QPN65895.1 polysaccharide biosynthesis tyrosine autokinase [Synechococcus sp. CBW1006]
MTNLTSRGTPPTLSIPQGFPLVPLGESPADQDREGLNPREILAALRRRHRLVLLTSAVVFLIAAGLTVRQRLLFPVYQGSFDLLITDPVSGEGSSSSGQGSGSASTFQALARNTTSNDIPTLIEVLRSPLLLQGLAERHDLSSDALAGRISIRTGGIDRDSRAEGVLKVSLTGRDPVQDETLLKDLANRYLQYSLEQRQERLQEGLRFLDRQAPALQDTANRLQAERAAFRVRYDLLEPTAEGEAIKQEMLALEVQARSLEDQRNRLLKTSQAIRNGTLTAQGFQEAIGAGGSGGSAGGSSGGGSGSGLSVAASSQPWLEQLQQLDQQLAEARARFTPQSDRVQGLQARREGLNRKVRSSQLEAVDAALALNRQASVANQSQLAALTSNFRRQPQLIREYEELEQRLQLALDNLTGLSSTRSNFRLELAQRTVPWRVIAPARMNPVPVEPSLSKGLLQAALLAAAAGAGVGVLRDRLDHVYRSPAEVKETLQEPLLAHIPHIPLFRGVREDSRFMLEEIVPASATGSAAAPSAAAVPAAKGAADSKQLGYQRFFYQEAFRNLFTSLRFLNTDQPLRSLALTSSLPAEGKSLVNVLLAKTLAELGQRVLLVDADLRKPQLHTRLGLDNLLGLSHLLTGDTADWSSLLRPVPGHDNWQVITAGRRPPDPARLLSSARMRQLIEDLAASDRFDLILYDTPPVLGLADAALVAEHLDGLLLLVSLEKVDRDLPREAIARIRSAGVPLLGLVTNAVKQRSEAGSRYGYGYGRYGYGRYGYGGYDTLTAAAYYGATASAAEGGEEGTTAAAAPRRAPVRSLRRAGQRLISWIDR